MNTIDQLKELNKKWSKKIKSPLTKTCRQFVFGDGDENADIIFIGEAPGKKEDETGKPFVGASGKFLDKMLDSIKLKRNNVYITNIVKCRPPNNRDPLKEEKEVFLPWLIDEIKIINPKIIITLGRHSLSSFIDNPEISKVHGTILNYNILGIENIKIYALYHPAAALYNGKLRNILIKDFKNIPAILKSIK